MLWHGSDATALQLQPQEHPPATSMVASYFYGCGWTYMSSQAELSYPPNNDLRDSSILYSEVVATFKAPSEDVCERCRRFRRPVAFDVRHPSDTVCILHRTEDLNRRKISGFPQQLDWLLRQQGIGVRDYQSWGPWSPPVRPL